MASTGREAGITGQWGGAQGVLVGVRGEQHILLPKLHVPGQTARLQFVNPLVHLLQLCGCPSMLRLQIWREKGRIIGDQRGGHRALGGSGIGEWLLCASGIE